MTKKLIHPSWPVGKYIEMHVGRFWAYDTGAKVDFNCLTIKELLGLEEYKEPEKIEFTFDELCKIIGHVNTQDPTLVGSQGYWDFLEQELGFSTNEK